MLFIAIISNDLIAIIILAFTIYLVKNNIIMSKVKTKRYLFLSFMTLSVIFLEILTVFLKDSPITAMRIPLIIANILGFSLAPVVPLTFAFLFDESFFKHRYKLAVPVGFHIVMTFCSAWTGWIFYVDANNEYSRGPLFAINVIINLYCFLIFIYANLKSINEYDLDEKIFLNFLYILIFFGNIIQIIFPNILLIWFCVSLSILLYYIFLRELKFKFDPATGVRNRGSFMEKMMYMLKQDTATIVMLDINSLKEINDTLGHMAGDKYIADAANIIKVSFQDIGITYRIGGDEFSVLCKDVCESKLLSAFKKMDSLLFANNRDNSIPLKIAYGYDIYKKANKETIVDILKRADSAMYVHKSLLKKQ